MRDRAWIAPTRDGSVLWGHRGPYPPEVVDLVGDVAERWPAPAGDVPDEMSIGECLEAWRSR